MQAPPVSLDKWYMDVVAPEGDAAILYHATLRVGSVPLRVRSAMVLPRDGRGRRSSTWTGAGVPRESDSGVTFEAGRWSGTWSRRAPGFRVRLEDGPDGVIDWHVAAPAGDAVVRIGDFACRGGGYVERLRMTMPPWRFAYRGLRWGRFIGERSWLVWIRWSEGPGGAQRVWVAGEHGVENAGVIDDDRVETPRASLRLARDRELHSASLHGTLGPIARVIAPLVPAPLLEAHETKWLSLGELASPRGPERGWAIHEVVRFAAAEGGRP
jgi:hypothetical protein